MKWVAPAIFFAFWVFLLSAALYDRPTSFTYLEFDEDDEEGDQ